MDADPARTALVLIDLQNDLVDPAGVVGSHGLAAHIDRRGTLAVARRLLSAARDRGLRVLHVGNGFRPGHPEVDTANPLTAGAKAAGEFVVGSWGAAFHPQVAPAPDEIVVHKRGMSAFAGTELGQLCGVWDVRTLLLGGVVTNIAVEGTARDAADRGLRPVVIADACAGMTDALHDFSCTVMCRFARVTDTDTVLAAR